MTTDLRGREQLREKGEFLVAPNERSQASGEVGGMGADCAQHGEITRGDLPSAVIRRWDFVA